jgi:hypothetical protein
LQNAKIEEISSSFDVYIYINIKRGEENGIKRLRMLCYARNEKGIVGGF